MSGGTPLVLALAVLAVAGCGSLPRAKSDSVPRFAVDPYWPKPLPDNWILGQVSGIAVDKNDTIWIVHRPATLSTTEKGAPKNPPGTRCCKAAPPVLEFDAEGNCSAAGAAQARATTGRRASTASTSTARATCGSPATATRTRRS